MAEVQTDNSLRDPRPVRNRRRGGPVNRIRRAVIWFVRWKWTAVAAIAFAISWSFHEVDEQGDREHERQLRIMQCTVQEVADEQQVAPRTLVKPILEACIKQEDKK